MWHDSQTTPHTVFPLLMAFFGKKHWSHPWLLFHTPHPIHQKIQLLWPSQCPLESISALPPLIRVSHKAAVEALAKAVITWRLGWGWRACLPNGLLTRLLTWDHCFPRVCLSAAAGYGQGERTQSDLDRSHNVFCNLILKMTYHYFCHLFYRSHRPSWHSVGDDYTEVWIPGGRDHCSHLGGWLPPLTFRTLKSSEFSSISKVAIPLKLSLLVPLLSNLNK